ncbi:ABC transporter substrate-binding protein, partial [bacterium]|nr:ABC transporter substrate-binding protein [bacterium]
FEYNFLKRPYELQPLVAVDVPEPEKRTVTWYRWQKGPSGGWGGAAWRGSRGGAWREAEIEATVYTIRLKPGIRYQDHPCFVEANRRLTPSDASGIGGMADFKDTATREMVAADCVLAFRRLADPRLTCPIIDTLQQNVLGLGLYGLILDDVLEAERERRKEAGGPLYNREQDEKFNPIRLDYMAIPLPGVRVVDKYAFEIVLERPYPQILFWMAMPFFAPVPAEALDFFAQPLLLERAVTFDKNPVGTGPFLLEEYDPTNQLVLARNPNYREDFYPTLPKPDPSDATAVAHYQELQEAGVLADAGKRMPMADRILFRREVEWVPRWSKFRQGYYDSSGISSDVFEQTISLSSTGDALLSDEMSKKGITLLTAPSPVVSYFSFNMKDDVVGGYGEKNRKLRQAICMAFDTEELIAIFYNGQANVAHALTPPGIYGYIGGEAGMSPVTHTWNADLGVAMRRHLDEAKRLLAEAGYENGFGSDGKQLVLYFDNGWKQASYRPRLKFVIKQFEKLGIRLMSRTTDYNILGEKIRSGNFQILSWGWAADYPDPENFLFLLYGPNARSESGGNNASNYASPDFDGLFDQMSNSENGPERLAVIAKMNRIVQQDAPWFGTVHPISFALVHDWYKNSYPNPIARNQMKYRRIDVPQRTRMRRTWNRPRWFPVALFLGILLLTAVPAVIVGVRHMRGD